MSHVVLHITLSNSKMSAGRTQITEMVLITAPRASSVQMELIMSILEYKDTPIVTAKKLNPLIIMDLMEVLWAIATASFLVL